ncbi:GlcG/HbpS family heme-binding protein [Aestuariivirga sp.]|uniref:GlcG/HbpS family heme-binding protein n=1 Tax=Aestuariivirga sp. TaxID=2650926 RepID=UPI0039E29281
MSLTLAHAQTIIREGLAHGRKAAMMPLTMVVLDARAVVIASACEDGSSRGRFDVARGKANGALAFNRNSRKLAEMVKDYSHFLSSSGPLVGGLVPVAGGVIIRDAANAVIGAVGVSGDSSDNDEACAMAGIKATGLNAEGG